MQNKDGFLNKKTTFNEFLRGVFGFADRPETQADYQKITSGWFLKYLSEEEKQRPVSEATKLKKIIDIFLDENIPKKDRDDQSVLDWRAESGHARQDLILSKKEHKRHASFYRLLSAVTERTEEARHNTRETFNAAPWVAATATACLVAFIFSVSIARFSPITAGRITNNADKLISGVLASLNFISEDRQDIARAQAAGSLVKVKLATVSGEELSAYIARNRDKLTFDKIGASIEIDFEDIHGRVAGLVEDESYRNDIAEKGQKDFSDGLDRLFDSIRSFIKRLTEAT